MYALKYLHRKHLLWIPAAVPIVGGCLFYLKQKIEESFAKSLSSSEYIYLPSELTERLLLNDDQETYHANVRQSTNSGTLVQDSFKSLFRNRSPENINQDDTVFSTTEDLQALKMSQSCDFKEIVKLALSGPNVKLNSFRVPLNTNRMLIRLKEYEDAQHFELDEIMTHLLRCANGVKEQSACARYLTEQALVLFEHNVDLNDIFFNVEYGSGKTDNQRYQVQRYQDVYFQAILENLLSSKEHVMCLLENGLLVLLHRLRELFPEKQVQNWISACLSALSVHEEAHQHLFHTGWIGTLVQWLNSSDLRLSLEAAKTLHNLVNKSALHRSLYILHPIYQAASTPPAQFDIVFIHGLQGGAFKTWRSKKSDTAKDGSGSYTDCWPKSWLASDFPDCRILAVNYQTFLSNWLVNCGHACTLKERSLQLAHELRSAHVGERPVIWVTHSMGGLLVKEMLCQIDRGESHEQSQCLLDKTKGIVFYSCPNLGSEMAVWSPHMQRIISPSAQVLELRKDSPTLKELNQGFIELVTDKQIDCLSFGEGKHSTLLRHPIEWKFLLVPEESANPGVGQFIVLPEDHFYICKPQDKQSESYQELGKFIAKLVRKKDQLVEPLQNDLLLSSCVL